MWSNMWLSLWPCSHDFSDFILSHLRLAEATIIDEHSSADLVCNCGSEEHSPCNSKDNVERNAHSFDSAHLLMSTQEVDTDTSSGSVSSS